jgi:molybdopterin-containing oxidoreductase family iron-sulfur binding subunit
MDQWRSLEELGRTSEFGDPPPQRFPPAARHDSDRRQFLKLMSASLALAGMTGCTREPQEKILPYVDAPVGSIAGEPRFYATAMTLGGFALGVLVESNMGRPTKIEGNPLHPASLGGTDIFAQACVLDLWDPDRSQAVTHRGSVSTWDAFGTALERQRDGFAKKQGDGLRVLTETVTSPTLAAQLQALLARYPKARWHQYDPVNRDNVYDATRMAFAEALDVRHRFDRVQTVLSLDADFLGAGNAPVRTARDFIRGRATRAAAGTSNRLYAIASTPSLTSAFADHALALRASDVEQAARRIARLLGVPVGAPDTIAGLPETWVAACVRDLDAHHGASIVIAGDRQPAIVHALAHAMNARLGNAGTTIEFTDPVVANPANQGESLRSLARDMAARAVDTLVVIGGNPVYCAPGDVAFAAGLANVAMSVHLGLYEDETSARCQWHLPATHFLEAWSDARAFDGTITLQQPLIAPLYAGRSAHELVAMLGEGTSRSGYTIVRAFWQPRLGSDFDVGWNTALRDGTVANTALPARTVTLQNGAFPAAAGVSPAADATDASLELQLVPDATLFDGRYANNAWLQELPKPLTKLTWDNAVLIAPALAQRMGLANEDVVELDYRGAKVEAPVGSCRVTRTARPARHSVMGARAPDASAMAMASMPMHCAPPIRRGSHAASRCARPARRTRSRQRRAIIRWKGATSSVS